MKKSFTLGAIAGMSTIALAVPVLAQFAGAQSSTASTPSSVTTQSQFPARPAPTIKHVQEMITRDKAFLANVDAMVTIQKSATQAHVTALTATSAITDDTQREAAVKKANEDMRATIQAAVEANPALKDAMPFGGPHGPGGKHGGPGGFGHGPGKADLAAKLGMTEVELKAALDAGKTIEQIATEKGVTLPARPMKMKGGFGGFFAHPENAQSSSVQ